MVDKDEYLFPITSFHGKFTPEDFVFNANLQEFALRVGYIVALQTNGKTSSEDAYRQIKDLVKELKISKKKLKVNDKNNG